MHSHCADCDRALASGDCDRPLASGARARPRADGRPDRTHRGGCRPRKPKVVPDAAHPGMWRARWPNGRLSDMTNLTRAKDAVAYFMETEEGRQRVRHRSSQGRLCVKTGEMPARGALMPASGEHGVVGARKQ
jgi:hypothetical protein